MLITVCFQKEAIIESAEKTHLPLINTHKIMWWLTACSWVTCLMEMKSQRVPSRRPNLYFPFNPIRTEFQNQSGILTTAQLSWACKHTDCFQPVLARAITSFFLLSGWLSPSVLHRLGLLHKVDLVKFHSAHLLPAPLSSESFHPAAKTICYCSDPVAHA